ncbi:olfactory receptor 14A2-like [Tachyglossus aculeatus]|uniref:olfactory receptor 14A2-like n=1 Tax=Tachyglossus aculeatus TaxID=9261 RepID=UPI0018F38ADB|nr:olfactory receptor 14A2-like [Tachyglossus aculeatus]
MPASESRAKAFSTCLPHFTVFTVFFFIAIISYLKPVLDSPSTLDLLESMFYTVISCSEGHVAIATDVSMTTGVALAVVCFMLIIVYVQDGRGGVSLDAAKVDAPQPRTGPVFLEGSRVFLVVLFGSSEMFIVTGMSYDRYVSICCLLGYEVFMNQGACGKMAAAYWLTRNLLICRLLHVRCRLVCTYFWAMLRMPTMEGLTKAFSTCPPHLVVVTAGLFAYYKPLSGSSLSVDLLVSGFYTVSCSENHITFDMSVSIGSCLGSVCLFSIKASYDSIFSTVPRIPSADSQLKAFSICLPHLLVVTVLLTISALDYLKPPSETSPTLDLLVSVFYTVLLSHTSSVFDLLMSVFFAVMPPRP